MHATDTIINSCFGTQVDRMATRSAVNALFTGDPKTDPVLFKVHQAMGLPGDKPILHAEHPVVLNCGSNAAFVLCPPDTHTTSSVINAKIPTNAEFIALLGTNFIQLIERVCSRVS